MFQTQGANQGAQFAGGLTSILPYIMGAFGGQTPIYDQYGNIIGYR